MVEDNPACVLVGGTLTVRKSMGFRNESTVVITGASVTFHGRLRIEFMPGESVGQSEAPLYFMPSETAYEILIIDLVQGYLGSLLATPFLSDESVEIQPPFGVDASSLLTELVLV